MPGADEQADERYKAQLRREEQNWDARFKYVLHSDLAAVQIGITALRTAILINAGASVALLAFAAQLWEKDKILIGKMLGAGGPFVWGLVISALASGIAYFYQSFITRKYHQELEEISANRDKFKPARWLPSAIVVTRVSMIVLVLGGYALFVRGAFSVTCAIQPTGMGCGPWW